MSKRIRWYVLLVCAPVVAFVLARVSDGWSDGALRAAIAGVCVLFAFVGLPWVEMARDGALRRRPRS